MEIDLSKVKSLEELKKLAYEQAYEDAYEEAKKELKEEKNDNEGIFNSDGSIKKIRVDAKKEEEDKEIFQNEPSIKITREQISLATPLKCELHIKASDKLEEPKKIKDFYDNATSKFRHMAKLSIKEKDEKTYVVTIISGQYRCSWCEDFRNYLKGMNAKIINCGSCSKYEKFGK